MKASVIAGDYLVRRVVTIAGSEIVIQDSSFEAKVDGKGLLSFIQTGETFETQLTEDQCALIRDGSYIAMQFVGELPNQNYLSKLYFSRK